MLGYTIVKEGHLIELEKFKSRWEYVPHHLISLHEFRERAMRFFNLYGESPKKMICDAEIFDQFKEIIWTVQKVIERVEPNVKFGAFRVENIEIEANNQITGWYFAKEKKKKGSEKSATNRNKKNKSRA